MLPGIDERVRPLACQAISLLTVQGNRSMAALASLVAACDVGLHSLVLQTASASSNFFSWNFACIHSSLHLSTPSFSSPTTEPLACHPRWLRVTQHHRILTTRIHNAQMAYPIQAPACFRISCLTQPVHARNTRPQTSSIINTCNMVSCSSLRCLAALESTY